MIRNYDLIVFDWDGTLSDSTQIIVTSIQKAAHDIGLPIPEHHMASSIIGLGLSEAIEILFGSLTDQDYSRLVSLYGCYYKSQEHEIPMFTGAGQLIESLGNRGHMLAVATGKGRNGLNRALERSGLQQHFHSTRCVDECRSKPHPQMLLELMDEFGVTSNRTLMVGDTSFDLQMAQNAGVAAVGVSYGAHPLESLLACNPIACFDSFEKLGAWITINA